MDLYANGLPGTYKCTLLNYSTNAHQTNRGYESSCDAYIESKGNGVLDIHDDAFVFAYLQVNEIPIILTPKECDQDVHKAK